jgi:hypothetical protein
MVGSGFHCRSDSYYRFSMRRALGAVCFALLAACGADDGGEQADAAICDLPAATIACTVGDDTPCTAVCAVSYCYTFGAGGGGGIGSTVCTRSCDTLADCPDGWSCNMMGRCKPP